MPFLSPPFVSLLCWFGCQHSVLLLGHLSDMLTVLCSVVQSCPTLCDRKTVARQAPLRKILPARIRSGLPLSAPGDRPDSGMEPVSPASARRLFGSVPPGKPRNTNCPVTDSVSFLRCWSVATLSSSGFFFFCLRRRL